MTIFSKHMWQLAAGRGPAQWFLDNIKREETQKIQLMERAQLLESQIAAAIANEVHAAWQNNQAAATLEIKFSRELKGLLNAQALLLETAAKEARKEAKLEKGVYDIVSRRRTVAY